MKDELAKVLTLKPNTLVLSGGRRQYATKSVGVLIKTFGAACENHFDKERYEFCWIVDFPMYEIGDESGELEFCHNPFSMPRRLEVLLKAERGEIDPLDIYANQYDLVCNGVELSSGAVRNHDPGDHDQGLRAGASGRGGREEEVPRHVQRLLLRRAPHAGIAPGVDRMVMLLAGESSIREIIPFPMNKNHAHLQAHLEYVPFLPIIVSRCWCRPCICKAKTSWTACSSRRSASRPWIPP